MKRFITIFLGVFMLSVLLVACGSIEDKLIGSWKVVIDGDTNAYMEIGKERIINREESNDHPITAEYILTETEDDNFIIEFVNPESGTNEFLFEGYFENKDTIKIVETPNGETKNSKLIRVDSIAEEMEKDKKEKAAKEEKEEKKKELAKEREEEKEKQLAKEKEKEEQATQLANEKEEEEEKQRTAGANSLKEKYLQKADDLNDKILREFKESHPHAQDMEPGFYGQYYGEWDDLLNEVWGVFKDTMPNSTFEGLKSDQREWVKMKEQNFAEMPDEVASARARGMNYLAFETKDRIYYLVENYLD